VLTTCQPSTVWCSRERLPAAAAQSAKVRQSCSATDYYYYICAPHFPQFGSKLLIQTMFLSTPNVIANARHVSHDNCAVLGMLKKLKAISGVGGCGNKKYSRVFGGFCGGSGGVCVLREPGVRRSVSCLFFGSLISPPAIDY
jgi:hypothetical protein